MSIFAISDLHLSLNCDKTIVVFPGWENYVDRIKENWFKNIKDDDTVIIAGDISWAKKISEAKEDFKFIHELPGKKIIFRGNHDYWWTTKTAVCRFLEENCFNSISVMFNSSYIIEGKSICGARGWMYNPQEKRDEKILAREVGRLKMSLDDAASKTDITPIVFLHYPPLYGNQYSEEIMRILIERNIKKCYYGHIHGYGSRKFVVEGLHYGIDFKLISCDYINFAPILVS